MTLNNISLSDAAQYLGIAQIHLARKDWEGDEAEDEDAPYVTRAKGSTRIYTTKR